MCTDGSGAHDGFHCTQALRRAARGERGREWMLKSLSTNAATICAIVLGVISSAVYFALDVHYTPDVLVGVLYTTVRDGKEEKYIHQFKAKDKPLLCVTPDGTQILLVGGAYDFTERGIVDRSDPTSHRRRR